MINPTRVAPPPTFRQATGSVTKEEMSHLLIAFVGFCIQACRQISCWATFNAL